MHNQVCYLVSAPRDGGGLAFAAEANEGAYTTSGSFFRLGMIRDRLLDEYQFHAIHGDRIVVTHMIRYRDSRAFYRVQVDGVGPFMFCARSIRRKPMYVGGVQGFNGLSAVRQVCPLRPHDLDAACRDHGFYFVGYSPMIDRQ